MHRQHVFNSGIKDTNLVEKKKSTHKRLIIKYLFLDGPKTNLELGKLVKLSTPKIISLLNELKAEGLIEELGQGDSSGGRRPNLYGNKEDAFYIIGISISIYKTSVTIFNAKNQNVSGNQELTHTISHGTSIIDPIVEFTQHIIQENRIPNERILGVGIEMPGLIDHKTGINKTYLISEQPVAEVFSRKFGMVVFIENDAKTRAFAELKFGLARKKQNVLVLNLDWGIGLGIIVNGKLYGGRDGFAGEFGHIPMIDNEILCNCGKQGCLETIASGTAISRMALDGIKAGRSTFLKQLIDPNEDNIEIRKVVLAATMGDQYSISILANAGHWLGKGFAILVQIFNPQLIILGGRMAEAGRFILPPIQQAIQIFCNPDLEDNIRIETSVLGTKAGVQGVAAMLLEHVLDKK